MPGEDLPPRHGQNSTGTSGEGDPGAEAPPTLDQTLSDLDQTLSDADQTLSDVDQTLSDVDQGAAQADQEVADSDERASGRDQAAADRDQEHASPDSASERAHDVSRAERAGASAKRKASAAARGATAVARTRGAGQRDEGARRRDVSAIARDRAAEARDGAAERKEVSLDNKAALDAADTAPIDPAATRRTNAARTTAASGRARAAGDRQRAAGDRARAADDRREARIDLEAANHDDLTGVWTRGMGLLTLRHEIERAHRSGEPFVLAFVDVDGLKQLNDSKGHGAGDVLLQAVAAELKSKLRSYNPVVRVGGDEFVCAFTDTDLAAAGGRVKEIQAALERKQVESSISVGLAQLAPGESLEDLTARGDAELYRIKHTS